MAVKKGKKLIKVDFTGVEAGGGGRVLPEGPIQLELKEIEEKEGEESGKPYLEFALEVVDGEYEGTKVWDNMSLQSQALWKLRGFMEAGGHATEDGPMQIDPDDLIGTVVMGDIIHEDYRGKTKNRVNGYSSVDAAAEPDAKTEKGGARKKAAGKKEPEFELKQKVSFKDGKKTLEGTITEIDEEKNEYTVKVGKEEYVIGPDDIEAA